MKTDGIALAILSLVASMPLAFAETNITITAIRAEPGSAVVLQWPSETGRWYRLEQTTNLAPGVFETVFPSTDATSPTNLCTNIISGTGARFFRIIGDSADSNRTDQGTSGNDLQIVFGTTNRDRIVQFGYEGDDTQYVSGNSSNDWIEQYGGSGTDSMHADAGTGDDRVYQDGGDGSDSLTASGAEGADTITQFGGMGSDTQNVMGGSGEDVLCQDGGEGDDQLRCEGGDQADTVHMMGGSGNDSLTYHVSAGSDVVASLDGGSDSDTVMIGANNQSFILKDGDGNTLYQSGTGGSIITVINVEHGQVKAVDETVLYEW